MLLGDLPEELVELVLSECTNFQVSQIAQIARLRASALTVLRRRAVRMHHPGPLELRLWAQRHDEPVTRDQLRWRYGVQPKRGILTFAGLRSSRHRSLLFSGLIEAVVQAGFQWPDYMDVVAETSRAHELRARTLGQDRSDRRQVLHQALENVLGLLDVSVLKCTPPECRVTVHRFLQRGGRSPVPTLTLFWEQVRAGHLPLMERQLREMPSTIARAPHQAGSLFRPIPTRTIGISALRASHLQARDIARVLGTVHRLRVQETYVLALLEHGVAALFEGSLLLWEARARDGLISPRGATFIGDSQGLILRWGPRERPITTPILGGVLALGGPATDFLVLVTGTGLLLRYTIVLHEQRLFESARIQLEHLTPGPQDLWCPPPGDLPVCWDRSTGLCLLVPYFTSVYRATLPGAGPGVQLIDLHPRLVSMYTPVQGLLHQYLLGEFPAPFILL